MVKELVLAGTPAFVSARLAHCRMGSENLVLQKSRITALAPLSIFFLWPLAPLILVENTIVAFAFDCLADVTMISPNEIVKIIAILALEYFPYGAIARRVTI